MTKQKIPNIRFKNYTDTWEQRKLGEHAIIKGRLGWKSLKQEEYTLEGPSMIAGKHIVNGKIDWTKVDHIPDWRYDESPEIMLENEDIIFSKDGSLGNPAVINNLTVKATINSTMMLVRTDKSIDSNFFYQILTGEAFDRLIYLKVSGSSIPHLFQADMNEFEFLAPSLQEQRKISTFLSSADSLIALHQRKLEDLKSFKATMLSKMFPKHGQTIPEIRLAGFDGEWERTKLGALGSVAMNKRIFKDETSEDGEIPFYKIGTFGGVADSFISRARFEEYKQKYSYPEIGDILISASGSIGRTVEYMGEEAYYQDSNIVWLKHDNRLVKSFLKQFYSIVKWNGIEGTTIKRLYNKNILETEIPLPSPEEQQAIGELFSNLDDLISSTQSKIEELETLKKKLLQEMFVN